MQNRLPVENGIIVAFPIIDYPAKTKESLGISVI